MAIPKCPAMDRKIPSFRELGFKRYRVYLDIQPDTEFFFVASDVGSAWAKFQWHYERTAKFYPSKDDWKIEEVKS
jgi:hypothetical protein